MSRGRTHVDQIIEDHSRLHHFLEAVREAVTARQAERTEIADLLANLTDSVLKHFQHEEQDGYFAAAVDVAPRLSERADELLGQHPALAEQLDRLQAHAGKGDPTELWWQGLHERFDRFLSCFLDHESAENQVIQQAYGEDIGAEG